VLCQFDRVVSNSQHQDSLVRSNPFRSCESLSSSQKEAPFRDERKFTGIVAVVTYAKILYSKTRLSEKQTLLVFGTHVEPYSTPEDILDRF
jgi:hypothetical protein